MAVFKIYDKLTKQWVPVGTNEAIGITTSNPALLKNGQLEANVEELLVDMSQEITDIKQDIIYMGNQQGALYWDEI